ncbi:unnamed protein product [Closterium sp. NIES-65]|nr:unnamed protein product [Closterium sp. NIES-65]
MTHLQSVVATCQLSLLRFPHNPLIQHRLQQSSRQLEQYLSSCAADIAFKAKLKVEGAREMGVPSLLSSLNSHIKASQVSAITLPSGRLTSNLSEINAHCTSFFSSLYGAPPQPARPSDFWRHLPPSSPPSALLLPLMAPFSLAEIDRAMASLAPGKMPGSDGLPGDFFRTYRALLGPVFHQLFASIWRSQSLPPSMRGGRTVLIPKRQSSSMVEDLRPITLMNADYKTLAICLANRLQPVLRHIIHPAQTAFVRGRSIGDTINDTLDLMEWAVARSVPLLVLTVDIRKAYDLVDREFMYQCLSYLGLPSDFITWNPSPLIVFSLSRMGNPLVVSKKNCLSSPSNSASDISSPPQSLVRVTLPGGLVVADRYDISCRRVGREAVSCCVVPERALLTILVRDRWIHGPFCSGAGLADRIDLLRPGPPSLAVLRKQFYRPQPLSLQEAWSTALQLPVPALPSLTHPFLREQPSRSRDLLLRLFARALPTGARFRFMEDGGSCRRCPPRPLETLLHVFNECGPVATVSAALCRVARSHLGVAVPAPLVFFPLSHPAGQIAPWCLLVGAAAKTLWDERCATASLWFSMGADPDTERGPPPVPAPSPPPAEHSAHDAAGDAPAADESSPLLKEGVQEKGEGGPAAKGDGEEANLVAVTTGAESGEKATAATAAEEAETEKTEKAGEKAEEKEKAEKEKGEKGDPKEGAEEAGSVPYWQLFRYADKWDVALMVVGSVGAIAQGIALPMMALLFGDMMNAFGSNTTSMDAMLDQVAKASLNFIFLAIAAGVTAYIQTACWMSAGERQAARLRSLYLQSVLRQDVGFFDTSLSTGEVVGHMSGDIVLVQEAMGEKVATCMQFLAQFLGGFVVAFISGWQLALVMLATLPLLAVAGGVITVVVQQSTSKGQQAYTAAGTIVEECVGAIRTVAAFTAERKSVQAYAAHLHAAFQEGVKQGLASGFGYGLTIFVMFCSYALALWYGSKLIADSSYTGGKVFSVLFGVIIGGMSLGQASPSFAAFASGRAAAYKIFQVIQRIPPIDSSNPAGETPPDSEVKGELELQDIVFAYPSRPDVTIFNGFSLKIRAGETVALVGESGSGKSTVVALVERFYDPQGGAVLLDGRSIAALNLRWLRQHMGLVSQEPALFNVSLRDNIAYGKGGGEAWGGGGEREEKGVSDEEVQEAARAANIHEFIESLPDGYNTLVGERGTQLSGGQKQRVAIARAILKDPRVLLLDEATSALDAESEKVVQAALERVMVGRTTVVVAHRLSTVRGADRIAVLSRGKVVQEGKHEELMKEGGAYLQLVKLQEMAGSGREGGGEGGSDGEGGKVEGEGKGAGVSGGEEGKAGKEGSSEETSSSSSADGDEDDDDDDEEEETEGEGEGGEEEAAEAGKGDGTGTDPEQGEKEGAGEKAKREKAEKKEKKKQKKKEKKDKKRKKRSPFLRLAMLNKPEWPYALSGTVAAAVQGVILPFFALILSRIITVFYNPDKAKMRSDADFWSLMFVILAVVAWVSRTLQTFLFSVAGQRLIWRIRRMCFHSVLRQEMAWFDRDENSSGAIGSRLSSDATHVHSIVGDRLSLAVQNAATLVAGLILAFSSSWILSFIVLAQLPLIAAGSIFQMRSLQGFADDAKQAYETATRIASDAVGAMRTVASFAAEGRVMALYHASVVAPVKAGLHKAQVSGAGFGFGQFCLFAVYGFSFWCGGQLVKIGQADFQSVFQSFFAVVFTAMGVAQTASLAPDMATAQAAVKSIFKLLDRRSRIDPEGKGERPEEGVGGEVQFQGVVFAYPSRPHLTVLQDFTLTIPAGKTVALVGESGSGKSTVVALVERFYDPQSGAVLLDGRSIAALNLRWLRQHMGLVSQEPALFNISIRDNIAYGRAATYVPSGGAAAGDGADADGAGKKGCWSLGDTKGTRDSRRSRDFRMSMESAGSGADRREEEEELEAVTETEIVEAAKSANAHAFISSLPEAYDTLVGERGTQLSGGQKQRVAIARAILKDPRVLLLDEATSALDAESEKVVQAALERVMVGRTTVVVAHRLSTVRSADCIVVMQKGRVVEQGTHDELLAKKGAYHLLVSAQR